MAGFPTFNLDFDNADANGRVEKWGHGYTWEFLANRQTAPTDPKSFAPGWFLSDCEVIPGLNAVSLLGYAPPTDQALSGWTVDSGAGYWEEEYPDWWPRAAWLFYGDARAGQYGRVTSTALYAPRIAVHLVEFAPPADQSLALAYTAIDLLGADADSGYRIALPLHSQAQSGKYPQIGHGEPGDFEVVDEFQRADGNAGQEGGVTRRTVWVEFRDGVIIIRCTGWSEPWMYEPDPDFVPVTGEVAVQFYGHAGMFNLAPIYYPASGYARPLEYRTIPVRYVYGSSNLTEQFGAAGEGVFNTDWTLTSEWPDGADTNRYRPRLGMTRIDACSSPLVYAIHDQFDTDFSAARSAPYSTQARGVTLAADGDDPAEAVGLSWRRGLWRDWSFTATIRDPNDFWVDYLKPNMKVTVEAGLDGELTQLMVGYIRKPSVERSGERERGTVPLLTIEGEDYIMARIAGKKFMRRQCSPAGWDLGTWAESVLINASVVATKSFGAGVTVAQERKGRAQYEFGDRHEVLTALDRVFAAHDWTPLAVDANGTIGAGEEATYSAPATFTLDEATATGDEKIERIAVDYQDEEFRNAVGVIGSLGALTEAVDLASVQDETDANFIGDDWWGMESAEEGEDPTTRAAKLLADWLGRRQLVKWTRWVKTDLPPGSFVDVTVDNLGVSAGTILRVVGDEGQIDPDSSSGRSTFYCEVVEV